jgi:acetyl-CoA acetyltransferase
VSLIREVVVAGLGETGYFKRGLAPIGQLGLCAQAVMAACEDAGVDVRDVDGIVSYGHDTNEGPKLSVALGLRELRWTSMVWGGGGGGLGGAFAHAAAAIVSGQASRVVVVRASAESTSGRLGVAVSIDHMNAHYRAHGIVAPAQVCALRTQRLIEHDGVPRSTLRAVAQAGYHHARTNPRAYGREVVLDDATYESARWIAEPYRLFDCSRENDGAGAILLVSSRDAVHLRQRPVHLVAAAQSAPAGWGESLDNDPDYTSAGFRLVADRLWRATGLGPSDVDVVQLYENFTGASVAAMIDHGFCTTESAGEVLRLDNLVVETGTLPINTAGGNVGEGFVHGIGLALEAVRQIRGESPNQVEGAELSLLVGGPMAPFVSSALFAAEAA